MKRCQKALQFLEEVCHGWCGAVQKQVGLYDKRGKICRGIHCQTEFRSEIFDNLAVASVRQGQLQDQPGGCFHRMQGLTTA